MKFEVNGNGNENYLMGMGKNGAQQIYEKRTTNRTDGIRALFDVMMRPCLSSLFLCCRCDIVSCCFRSFFSQSSGVSL